jgi:hypothetical protein
MLACFFLLILLNKFADSDCIVAKLLGELEQFFEECLVRIAETTAPLRRPSRQGRLNRVPRGSRRLPSQGRAAPGQVRPLGNDGWIVTRPRPSKATVTVRPSPAVPDGS